MSDFQVECYAGYRGDESPRALIIHGHRYLVTEVIRRWQEPGGRYFRLRASNGGEYVVYNDTAKGAWSEASHADRAFKVDD